MESDAMGEGASTGLTPWTLWAKWARGTATRSYHPVLCHLTDVAMAAEALWRRVLPWRWKERLATALGLEVAEAERWVVFWAGLHDIGKVCPGFQLQLEHTNPAAHALIVQRLRTAGLPWRQVPWIAHGDVSAKALQVILPAEYGCAPDLANAVAVAIGGHHGRFQTFGGLRELSLDCVGDNRWQKARIRYAAWLAEAVGPFNPPAASAMSHPTAMALAGLVSVADWIGSSAFFGHAAPDAWHPPALDIHAYRDAARQKAHEALDALGWTGWAPSDMILTFRQLFPAITEPRPLQDAIVAIADDLAGPGIVIAEAPMGEGKTEVAMYLADHWSTTLGQRGIYFALPTQATSDSMFERVRDFLRQRYPTQVVNLQLQHGHAALSETLKEMQRHWHGLLEPGDIYAGTTRPETAKGEVVAAEWFASGKRAMLAPFGVGTVDQALLGALQIMHVFVRLYGLSTKTVIVDEVHAYDAYMSTLLERLLEWLGALQTPVVLLSATLPAQRRQQLLAAYAKGAGWSEPSASRDIHYPRITWASATNSGARQTQVSALNRRAANVEWLASTLPELGETAPFSLGERLVELLAGGGCAAVICNTVARAQRTYEALKPYFSDNASDGDPLLDLLHARYPHEDRAKREARLLRRFGKQGAEGAKRPHRAVVVATQVIEQSLDLDFDVMVTDLAPADLVLQRIGRLHRHLRPRPTGLESPRLLILWPEIGNDGTPIFGKDSEAVYDAHILLRSYLALAERTVLALPDDIELLVEAVYGPAPCPADADAALRARWDETLAALEQARNEERQQATFRYIKHPRYDGELAEIAQHPREEDAPELSASWRALTRLADESVPVICLAGTPDHPLLRPNGPPARLRGKLKQHEVEALLRRSVSLSNKRFVRALREQPVPGQWDDIPLLRNHRPVFFDAQGTASSSHLHLRLDPELGIVME